MDKAEKIAELAARNYDWEIEWDGVELIADQEDCALVSYKCPAGVWTCGWGETDGVVAGMTWTQDEADSRFLHSVNATANKIKAICTSDTGPNQLAALTSLGYNIGTEALSASTVMKAHNAGDYEAAARAYQLWNKAKVNGTLVALPDLTARRAAEAALYLKPEDSPFARPSVQAVASESSISKSPIAISSTTGIAGGLVAIAGSTLDTITPIFHQAKDLAEAAGVNPLLIFGGIVTVSGGVSLWHRIKQRKQGWA